jgi:outer membrane lipoprotein-sorting protein
MSQNVNKGDQLSAGASIATHEGLVLLRRNYSVAYLESPNPVPLDREAGENEPVVKLKLDWRSTQEGIRQIEMSVNSDGYIRRFIGITPENDVIQFDFTNIIVNQNIPDTRFNYTLPASANTFENFLFEPGN